MSASFEGPEKKVELVVGSGHVPLRTLGDGWWRQVVGAAQAEVLSKISNEEVDAYLLSESSLFVWDRRVLLITCGRTTLIEATLMMVERFGADQIELLVFERKNEHFPEAQPSTFIDDAKRLHRVLPGRAYRFGDLDEHHVCLFHLDRPFTPGCDAMTLEVLMHGIDERARSVFCRGRAHNLAGVRDSGIHQILPGFAVDEYLFEPMGYSLNGIRDHEYFTVHVTPQEVGSYVSFETNHGFDEDELQPTIDRLLEVFRPSSCDIVLFEGPSKKRRLRTKYRLRREVKEDLSCGFSVRFRHYFELKGTTEPAQELKL